MPKPDEVFQLFAVLRTEISAKILVQELDDSNFHLAWHVSATKPFSAAERVTAETRLLSIMKFLLQQSNPSVKLRMNIYPLEQGYRLEVKSA